MAASSVRRIRRGGFQARDRSHESFGILTKRDFVQSRPRDAGDLPTPDQLKVIEHLWADLAEYVDGAKFAAFRRGFMTQGASCRRSARSRARRRTI
jgi:hypothetical protein